jgi:hypothetical protein
MTARPAPRYTARQLYDFAASYLGDADWYKWHATQTRDDHEAEHDRLVAAKLECAGKGYLFRAREMAYDANGGKK